MSNWNNSLQEWPSYLNLNPISNICYLKHLINPSLILYVDPYCIVDLRPKITRMDVMFFSEYPSKHSTWHESNGNNRKGAYSCTEGIREDAYSRTGGIFIRHGIRHIQCDSMKHKVILHWITMNMPYSVPYPVWKCLPYGSTHPP